MGENVDVLVVGSGLAGLSAAVRAAEEGASVVVATKASIGGMSCTRVSQGGFTLSAGNFSPERHREQTLVAGRGLNEGPLVERLVRDAPAAVEWLKKAGVRLVETGKGYACPGPLFVEGDGLLRPLIARAAELGVRFRKDFLLWGLIIDGDACLGVVGYDRAEKRPDRLLATSTILASGGLAGLYSRSDNPTGITGDGIAACLRSGLALMDLELVQFYPLGTAAFPRRFLPPLLGEIGRFRNKAGEDLLQKYGIEKRPVASRERDRLSRAIMLEAAHGGVWLDLTGEDDWQKAAEAFGTHRVSQVREAMERLYRISREPLAILPTAHFSMGGLPVDVYGRTSVKGLYACGEIAAGVHGANRLGGNALTEAVVFGRVTGMAAAGESPVKGEGALWKEQAARLDKVLSSPRAVRDRLGAILWDKVGVIRSGSSLKQAMNLIGEAGTGPEGSDPASTLENDGALLVGRAVVASALAREESRGAHFRSDFPSESAEARHSLSWLVDGEIVVEWLEPGFSSEGGGPRRPGEGGRPPYTS